MGVGHIYLKSSELRANGWYGNDERGPIGGKDGFGIESGGDREEEGNVNGEGITGLPFSSTREVSSTASSRNLEKTYLNPLY